MLTRPDSYAKMAALQVGHQFVGTTRLTPQRRALYWVSEPDLATAEARLRGTLFPQESIQHIGPLVQASLDSIGMKPNDVAAWAPWATIL